jgi:hypothetical protein
MSALVALAASLVIDGRVQFWHRECDAAGACGLPVAVSEKLPVSGTIDPPAGPGQLGYFATDVAGNPIQLKFELFWKGEDQQGVPYLAVQAVVRRTDEGVSVPLAQCNTFHDVPASGVFFPAGVCGGFSPAKTGYDQWGVTFYRGE